MPTLSSLSAFRLGASLQRRARRFHSLEVLETRIVPAGVTSFTDPHPSANDGFGTHIVPLPNGNVVVTAPNDDTGATDAGAVYLFNGMSGALISELHGSTATNRVGLGGVVVLTNGNFVAISPDWDGAATNVGAVTWGSGTSGVSGTVSAANSLVGSSTSDQVGNLGVTPLANGNYVVRTSTWDNAGTINAGAVTWGDGTIGVKGAVSAANSLVGSVTSEQLGFQPVVALKNGNYVVRDIGWNGAFSSQGAVTWGDGTVGVRGLVSAANSLIGTGQDDIVGSDGIVELPRSNYLVLSTGWDNNGVSNVGAVTWVNGATGLIGTVSAANSLIGSTLSDHVGDLGVTVLANGNYVVLSALWNNGAVADVGAATWGSGTSGVTGVVSAANSLIGSSAGDNVSGYGGVKALSNGNYVVCSPKWDSPTAYDAGAVTWADGTTGLSGVVSVDNSLYGTTNTDQVGNGFTVLPNGNYVVRSTLWDNGGEFDAGAVTWVKGTTGLTGPVTPANSLVGSYRFDNVGGAATVLSNGNYLIRSSNWDNGAAVSNAGAVTWNDANGGVTGPITASNSLVGSTSGDQVGNDTITELTNGNYVVRSRFWHNGAAFSAGAVTWASGAAPLTGVVSAANSLVGTTSNNQVGSGGVVALSNGSYVVVSPLWDGTGTDVGAVTWGNGTTGVKGSVSAANSLVGSLNTDQVGSGGVQALSHGNYLVTSPLWDNGGLVNAGAATWGNGNSGVNGVINSANSILGPIANTSLPTPVLNEGAGTFLVGFPTAGTVQFAPQSTGFGTPAIPMVASLVRAGGAAAHTSAGSVNYTVTFSEAVAGVDATDFLVHTDGSAGAAPLVTVTPVTYLTFTVTLSGLHGQGDVRLDLVDNDSIFSLGGPLRGAGVGNGSYQGPEYHLLQSFPQVTSIKANGNTTTSASNVSWTVNLSASVTGVDPSDFALVLGNGTTANPTVEVTGSGAAYVVTATNVSGIGSSLALQLVDNGSIRDANGNPLQGTAPPTFAALTEPGTGDYPNSVAVADLNADGKMDLVTTNQGGDSFSVLLGDGSGGFGTKTDYAVGSYPDCVTVADLNGDGKPDLVTSNSNNNSVSVRLGDGSGGFGAQTFVTTGSKPHFVVAADMNSDGKPDLVTVSYVDYTVSVLLGNGSGGFAPKMDFGTGSTPYAVAVADLNADGKLDIAVANSGGSSVSVLLGQGDGSLAARTDFATGSGPYAVAVADVNRDGQPDLVTANNSANTVSVLLGDGHGSFGTKTDFATGSLPTFVRASDVNGDGRFDLVVANSSGNTAGLLLGDGSGGFAAQTTFAAGTTPRSLAVADVNGDGRADFVITNSGSDNVSVLLGAGAGTFTGEIFTIEVPAISLTVVPAAAIESSGLGLVYTFTRTGSTSQPLTVSFTNGGTAVFTTDYTASSSESLDFSAGTITIPAGSSAATLALIPIDDRLVEGNETAILNVDSRAGYSIFSGVATGTIADNDTARLSLGAPQPAPAEGGGMDAAVFTLTLTTNGTGPAELASAIDFRLIDLANGTASAGVDYTFTIASFSFPIGATNGATRAASFDTIADDAVVERPETVKFSAAIDAGPATFLGSNLLMATIQDNDTASVTLSSGSTVSEGQSGTVAYTLTATLDHAVQGGFSVGYGTSDGTATLADNDYVHKSGTLIFAASPVKRRASPCSSAATRSSSSTMPLP